MKQLFVNNFSATVAQTFGASDTSLYINSAAGLPPLTGGDYLLLTVFRKTGVEEREHEVLKATAITGNMLTVVRSVEGAAASQFLTGDRVEVRFTALGAGSLVQTNDARLSDARVASDVSAWAKAGTKPSYTKSEVGLASADNTSDANKPVSTAQATALALKESTANKDASGGYAGLTQFKLNLRNAANTLTSWITTAATVARTWTMPDKDGTVAMTSDLDIKAPIASPTFTGILTAPDQAIALTANNLPAIRPTLNLDFANSKAIDPRITFTRASTASYYGADGIMHMAASGVGRTTFDPVTGVCEGALIEESKTNLLTYSEDFANSTGHGNYQATITPNVAIAPDGTVTADKLVESAVSGGHSQNSQVNVTSGNTYTNSCFFKAAERGYGVIGFSNVNGAFENISYVFDLQSGVITFSSGTFTSSVVSVGNGWFRASITTTSLLTTAGYPYRGLSSVSNAVSYTGNGTSGLYIWGAQLESGQLSSYIPSSTTFTSRASAGTFIGSNGLIQSAAPNVARWNYNPMNLTLAPKLLLEGASTNLALNSEVFSAMVGVSVTTNTIAAPDGQTTADLVLETAITNEHYPDDITLTPSLGVYIWSVYAKEYSGNRTLYLRVAAGNIGAATFDLVTGTTSGGTITAVGSGWYRCSLTMTMTSATLTVFRTQFWNAGISYAGDTTKGMYLWGRQVEPGTLTSYIPTTSAQVTRAADLSTSAQTTRAADVAAITGANFSSFYRQDEGSFVVKWNLPINTLDSNNLLHLCKYASSEAISVRMGYVGGRRVRSYAQDEAGAFQYVTEGDINASGTAGVATVAWKSINDFATSQNGAAAITDSTGLIAPYKHTHLYIGTTLSGWANGSISSLRYYPKRLSNLELQALSAQ